MARPAEHEEHEQLICLEVAKTVSTRAEVMALFRQLMRGPVAAVFARAERGELCSALAPPSERVRALETELRAALKAFGIRAPFVAAWSVCDTHFWELTERERFDSPVLVTLNCAPGYCGGDEEAPPRRGGDGGDRRDDRGGDDRGDEPAEPAAERQDGAFRWTQEYIPTVLGVLHERGAWPERIVPLVTDFRCVCPVLVARSFAARGAAALQLGALGCSDFGEAGNSDADRELYGWFTRVLHEHTRAWLRVAHARPSVRLSRAGYDRGAPGPARRADAAEPPPRERRRPADAADADAPFCAASPTGSLYVCVGAHHPGHDAYRHGALLNANVRAWAVAGAIVSRFEREVLEAGGLTAELAEAIVAYARGETRAARALADELAPVVAQRMRARGYARILEPGPYGGGVAAREPVADDDGAGLADDDGDDASVVAAADDDGDDDDADAAITIGRALDDAMQT